MSDDRELLEKAAKAAGYEYEWDQPRGAARPVWIRIKQHDRMIAWRPLTDDGDALRLAVKLRLTVVIREDDIIVNARLSDDKKREFYGSDPYAATRRAIVRAAASLATPRREDVCP